MTLYFSIDALSPAGNKAWRLLNNDQWRECVYAEPLQHQDARITDQQRARPWVGRRLKKDMENVLSSQRKAGIFDFLMRGIYAHAVLHRLSPAPIPDKKQMLEHIKSLEPGIAWLVYLNVTGHFCAMDTGKTRIIGNLDITVRGEIASSEDFIGPKASENEKLMDEIYHQFLAGWLHHLKSSNMSVFVPDAETLQEEADYIEAIHNWQPEQSEN